MMKCLLYIRLDSALDSSFFYKLFVNPNIGAELSRTRFRFQFSNIFSVILSGGNTNV